MIALKVIHFLFMYQKKLRKSKPEHWGTFERIYLHPFKTITGSFLKAVAVLHMPRKRKF